MQRFESMFIPGGDWLQLPRDPSLQEADAAGSGPALLGPSQLAQQEKVKMEGSREA